MARQAMTEEFQQVSIGDKIGLFTDIRIDRSTVPEGAYFYEIRHADESGWDPVQLGLGIMANFYGTLITKEPIEMDSHGYADIEDGEFQLLNNGSITLSEFLQGKEPYQLSYCAVQDDDFLRCYSDSSRDKELGCVGHLRADFGRNEGFFTTWHDHCPELNTEVFKEDFNKTIAIFRRHELKDFDTMSQYCWNKQAKQIPERYSDEFAFLSKRKTKHYEYYLRMTPQQGYYHVYLYCYDLDARAKHQTRQNVGKPMPKHKRDDMER